MHAVKTISDLAMREMPIIQALVRDIGDLNTRITQHYNEFNEFKIETIMRLSQIENKIDTLEKKIDTLEQKMNTLEKKLDIIIYLWILILAAIVLK